MVRLAAYGGISCATATYVVLAAFRQRSNFFSAAVYLSKSNACMMILWNLGVFVTILFGRALQSIFFGPLRLLEIERLHERAWYAVTESLLALTIFREEFDTSFVVLFVSLLFLKVFHWLAGDRVEMMEQNPNITRLFHIRMVTVLSTLWVVDVLLIAFAADTILSDGPSVMIMFASEYMIMLATLLGITLKYGVNVYDLRSEIPWENKSVFVFYIELACDFLKLATYLCFFSLILTFYGLPLNILRDVYITARSFVVKIRDLSRYRQATRNMNERYPDATVEEMERSSDKTCIICRDDMVARSQTEQQPAGADLNQQAVAAGRQGLNDTPKKLPCGHIFHFHCLRSWLERQQSCPTCRRPVLGSNERSATGRPAQPAPQPGQAARPADGAASGTLAVPTGATGPSASGSATGSGLSNRDGPRPRRAGIDNPLVAFQRRDLSPAAPRSTIDARPIPARRASLPSTEGAALAPDHPALNGASVTSGDGPGSARSASTPVDERMALRQRIEAAARLRQAAASKNTTTQSPGPTPPASMSGSSLPPIVPTPTIKVDEPHAALAEPWPAQSQGSSSANPQQPKPTSLPSQIDSAPLAATSTRPMSPLPYTSRGQMRLPTRDSLGDFESFVGLSNGSPPSSRVPKTSPYIKPPIPRATRAAFESIYPNNQSFQLPSFDDTPIQAHDVPRLIPLFDPANPVRPSSIARLLPTLGSSNALQSMLGNLPSQADRPEARDSPALPDSLSEEQLAILSEITKEGLETRLKLLQSTQDTLQACMKQMQQALSAISSGDIQGAANVAAELSQNVSADAVQGSGIKGKGKDT